LTAIVAYMTVGLTVDVGARSSRHNRTIVVADDDVAIRRLTRLTLTAQDWTVLEAATPEECLAIAIRERPAVVLLDVNFAGSQRDGYSVCREITTRRETKGTRVILMTARDDPERRAFASAVGASAFIVKPFGPFDLVGITKIVREETESDPAIGLYLIETGVIRAQELERALAEQRMGQGVRRPLGEILVELGFASKAQVSSALQRQRRQRAPARRSAARLGTRVSVLIADDNMSVRQALRELVNAQPDLTVVGVAADGADALRQAREMRPDVLILDNDMPQLSGLDVLKVVKAESPEAIVLMFTLDDSIGEPARALGAANVLTKDLSLDALVAEIRRCARDLPRGGPSRFVLTTRTASAEAWGTIWRIRRSITVVGLLVVLYAAAFLVAELSLGASAAVLATIFVAVGGALLGPEVGMLVALLGAGETAALWAATGHAIGEPILRVGGNGLGVVALVGIGAGFGGTRWARSRLRSRERRIASLAETALTLSQGLNPATLGLLAAAVFELVPGDSALLFVAVPGGGLELVATAGRDAATMGSRPGRGAIATAYLDRRTVRLDDVSGNRLGMRSVAGGSAIVSPILGSSGASGVIAVLSRSRSGFAPRHEHAVETYASFLAALLSTPPGLSPAIVPSAESA
jgi:DNA-binding NarL/FixJ family response regulator